MFAERLPAGCPVPKPPPLQYEVMILWAVNVINW